MKMKSFMFAAIVAITSVGAVSLVTGCDTMINKYDSLSEKDETCSQKWADYDAQLQRRYDLVPNLVNTVKASAAHEENTLKEVVEARAAATQIKLTGDDFSNPEKMAAFQKAQEQMKGSLSKLMMVQEAYPDLKANAQFHDLMVQLEGTENRILRAREEYNKAVKDFNFDLRRASGKAINPMTGHEFKPRIYFSADEGAKTAPKVDFGSPASSK